MKQIVSSLLLALRWFPASSEQNPERSLVFKGGQSPSGGQIFFPTPPSSPAGLHLSPLRPFPWLPSGGKAPLLVSTSSRHHQCPSDGSSGPSVDTRPCPQPLQSPTHFYALWQTTMHLFVHGVPCSPGPCCRCASQAVPRQLGTCCRLTVVLYDSWPRPFPPAMLVRAQLCESAELWVRPVTPAGALPAMSWAGCQELWGRLGTHSPSGSAERRWASWVAGLGRPSHPAPSLKRPRGTFMGI